MPSLAEPTRRAGAVDGGFLDLGHEVFDADGARFVRDRSLTRIYDANYVSDVRVATPDAVERLLAQSIGSTRTRGTGSSCSMARRRPRSRRRSSCAATSTRHRFS